MFPPAMDKGAAAITTDFANQKGRFELRSSLIPPVSYGVFFNTSALALIFMAVLSVPACKQFFHVQSGSILDHVTCAFDPILMNTAAVYCVSVIVFYGMDIPFGSCTAKCRRYTALVLPVATVLTGYCLTQFLLKRSFGYERPQDHLPEPWLIKFLKFNVFGRLGIDMEGKAGMPSHAVFSQFLLLFLGLTFFRPFRHSKYSFRLVQTTTWERAAIIVLLITTLLVVYGRIVRGFQNLSDIAISAGVACYLFWLFFYVAAKFSGTIHKEAHGGLVATTLINFPVFFFFSQDAHWWIFIFIFVVILLGIVKLLFPPQPEA